MSTSVPRRGKRWAVVVDAGRDANGKRIRKWHSGYATKREAESARVEVLASMQRGEYAPPNRVTVDEWLRQWLDGRTNLAETSRGGYEADVKRISKGLGHVRLRDLTTAQISAYWKQLSDSYAPKTVRNTQGTLHKALADAVRQGVLTKNAAVHAELPRAERVERETWTADQLSTFLDHARTHRLYASFHLMCSTGMRRSELLGVRWQNLDLETGRPWSTPSCRYETNRR